MDRLREPHNAELILQIDRPSGACFCFQMHDAVSRPAIDGYQQKCVIDIPVNLINRANVIIDYFVLFNFQTIKLHLYRN
ncbi:hypothetical protein RU07_12600 [Agrobacterium tumefaciens]|uniref:Uncharacterized protein n=1 Tax=Agrobacterium tumefaciens TaxID=358 RepID=A0A0D0K1V9_AGRTU|nr:hypothetical protein RU07_12600 [Agrobacterium tumefaciens]